MGSSRVTHPFATRSSPASWMDLVRLACVKHAASVRPEPGSNSPSRSTPDRGPVEISVEPASPWRGTPTGTDTECCCPFQCIELTAHRVRPEGRGNGEPALAFPSSLPFSRCAAPAGAGRWHSPRWGVGAGSRPDGRPLSVGPGNPVPPSGAKGHATGIDHRRQLGRGSSRTSPGAAGRSARATGRRPRRRRPATPWHR